MRRADTYESKTIPKYKIFYHSSNNNLIYSSSTQKFNNISRIENYIASEVDNSTIRSDNKYLSSYRNNSSTNHIRKNNACLNIYNNNDIKTNLIDYKNNSKITSNKYKNISNIPRRTCGLNMKQKQEMGENYNNPEMIFDYKLNNAKKVKKFNFIETPSSCTLNNSIQRNNHSFYEVKSLKKDFLGQKKNKLAIKITSNNNNDNINYLNTEKLKERNTINISNDNRRKNSTNKFFNINYNINNNINLIINSKKVKYIPRNSEITFNKNKINIKNITSSRPIKHNYTRRHELTLTNKYKLNKINSYHFSYIPKKTTKNELFENKSSKKKKRKKMNVVKRLILKNLNSKTFEEDFPIQLKYNRRYRINKKLKPQISLRLSLFKISKPEIEKYFVVNFFYSENLKSLNKDNSEYFFEK